jgi:DNA (cytosine-5)-methyltransferase 1
MTMRSLELFSGAGGLAKGLEHVGFRHAQFVEFNKHACNSLRVNFDPNSVFCGDVRDFDFSRLEDIDLVAGGPPCQPFSMAGKHMAYDDARDMFPYAAKAVSHYHPKAFIFENVKGLLRPSFACYFSYIILRLTYPEVVARTDELWSDHYKRLSDIDWASYAGVKYTIKFRLLNAANYGVPQIRERVFIVGIRSDLNVEWQFPEPTHDANLLYLDQFISGDYWQRHNIRQPTKPVSDYPQFKKSAKFELAFEAPLKPWLTVRDALADFPHPAAEHDIPDHVFRDGARSYAGHTGSYIDLPAKTLKAGGHGVPGGENMIRYEDGTVRYFTVFEGKILQTFSPDFCVTGAWGEGMRQIGNAVPTALARQLGKQLMSVLLEADKNIGIKPPIFSPNELAAAA